MQGEQELTCPIVLSLSLPEREIGVKLTYGPVWDAPMSIPALKFFNQT